MAKQAKKGRKVYSEEEKAEWDAKRRAKLKSMGEELAVRIAGLRSSEEFTAYLKWRSRFHKYSFYNSMWIYYQMPTATRVAGAGTWISLGRWPKKDSTALYVLRPNPFKVKDVDKSGTEIERVIKNFKPTPVFDISQTDGKPVPEEDFDWRINADLGNDIFPAMVDFVRSKGIDVEIGNRQGGADGYAGNNFIYIVQDSPTSQKVRAIAHEYAHTQHSKELSYADGEVIADTVAHIVCEYWGIPTGNANVVYIDGWAGKDQGQDKIRQYMDTVLDIADEFNMGVGKLLGANPVVLEPSPMKVESEPESLAVAA